MARITSSVASTVASSVPAGLSRRHFLAASLAAAGALAGVGASRPAFAAGASSTGDKAASSAKGKVQATADGSAAGEAPDADTTGAKQGGTLRYFITNPASIIPYGPAETQGVEVLWQIFDQLTVYDWGTDTVQPLAAESFESNDDATQFTFHLRKDLKFHNGDPVKAENYVYAWNQLVHPSFNNGAPSTESYNLAQVAGYDDAVKGAGQLDLETPDDYTLVVNLAAPFADFGVCTSTFATSAVPLGVFDSDEAFQQFSKAPVGNGPFKLDGQWEDGQYIKLVRNDDYPLDKPFVDGVTFQIFKDDITAWTEFQAGNLEFVQVPSGQFTAAVQQFGKADKDGYLSNPGKQVLSGTETANTYILVNWDDPVLGGPDHKDLRAAISEALDRQATAQTVYEGNVDTASDILTPNIPGYQPDTWPHTSPNGDKDKAAELFDKAGYPADASGKRNLSLTFAVNSGSANESLAQMVQADLAKVGVDVQIDVQEWATFLQNAKDRNYQFARLGKVILLPSAYEFLQPLFTSDSGENYSGYASEAFDAALKKASQIADADERAKAYYEADKILAEDFPVIPLFYRHHAAATSKRVHNFFYNGSGFARFQRVWLDA